MYEIIPYYETLSADLSAVAKRRRILILFEQFYQFTYIGHLFIIYGNLRIPIPPQR